MWAYDKPMTVDICILINEISFKLRMIDQGSSPVQAWIFQAIHSLLLK